MLVKPEHKVLSALAALQGNTNFETILEWMAQSRQTLYADSCRTKDDVLSRWQQGAAQAVDDFLTNAQNAQEVIRKSR
jgi:hypothetical protein